MKALKRTSPWFIALAIPLLVVGCQDFPTEIDVPQDQLTGNPNTTADPGAGGAPNPQGAPALVSGKTILIYGPSMSAPTGFRPDNEQTLAVAAGHTVTVASAAAWSSFNTATFASFDAIVFGDRTCAGVGVVATANGNKATWSAAISGPMYVQGADPQWHQFHKPETLPMITSGINFAAGGSGTGLYVSLSCYYAGAAAGTTVQFLSAIGSFTVSGQFGCPGAVTIADAAHSAMAGLTNAGLSNWGCAPHEFLLTFPSSFGVLAEAVRPNDGALLPYIIATPDNQPPDCSAAAPSIDAIWPANHKFVSVDVTGVTDPDGDAITINIDAIFQDEPTDTNGDGAFTPDGAGVGTSTAEVRAERAGTPRLPGDGRVYHISFTASDTFGATCSGTVQVGVPHDQRGDAAVDGGPLFDSTI